MKLLGDFGAIIKKISFRFRENFKELLRKFRTIFEKILLNF